MFERPRFLVCFFVPAVLAMVSASQPVLAQTSPPASVPTSAAAAPGVSATSPAAAHPSAAAVLISARVEGVTPGMGPEELVMIGYKNLETQQLQTAERVFQAVIEEDHANFLATRGLAMFYSADAKRAQASTSDPNAEARYKDLRDRSVKYSLSAAALASAAGNWSGAEESFKRAILLNPGNPAATLGLARASTNLGTRDGIAIERYRDYLNKTKTPNAPPDTLAQAGVELARVYRRARFPAQSLDALQEANRRDRENPDVYIEMARAHLDMAHLDLAHYDKAMNAAKMAITKSPGNADYYDVRARVHLALKDARSAAGDAQTAIALAQQAIRQQPESQSILRMLDGYYSTYQQALNGLLAEDPSNPAIRIEKVRSNQAQAEVRQAIVLFECLDILRSTPPSQHRNPRLLEAFINVYTGLNQPARAEEMARQLLLMEPTNAIALRVVPRSTASQPAATQATR